MSDHPEHDCAATCRTYFLGFGSCAVCKWSLWRDIRTTLAYSIRSTLNGDRRSARRYEKAMGMRRVFTWRYGWEWTSGDPEQFKAARRAWEREVGKRAPQT